MNRELLTTLSCPACRGELDLTVIQEADDPANASDAPRSGDDVFTGLLKCGCGRTYPVLEGVPRLLESESRSSSEFEDNLKREVTTGRRLQYARCPQSANDVESIRRSFSEEWRLFDYASDKTWGWTLEERKRVFLDDVALTARQIKDARLLDAGCGNGTLTASLGALAREVIGIDLNDGLGMANRNRARYDYEHWRNVQFVQGDLCEPPLKSESFDLIYCSGVIHHTPDSKETFQKLLPLVKKGGRLYVWVYGDRNLLVRLFVGSGRQRKRVMSVHALSITCRF